MATGKARPNQHDSKYRLSNGNYDQDAFLRDYYAWLDDMVPSTQDFTKSNPRPQKDRPSDTGSNPGFPSTTGPGNAADPDQLARATPVAPDAPEQAPAASDGQKDTPAPDTDEDGSERPWWETEDDALDTATGTMMGGPGAEPMPADWMGEIQNFRAADQKRLKDQYAAGTTDTDFRTTVHQARQDRHDTYAHGYDHADKDALDDDHRSAANAAFFEDPSWLDEVDQMEPGARKEYIRALQAADPESAQVILDEDRARRAGQR